MTIWLELWMKADHRCLATCSGSSMLPKIYVFFNPWYRIITSMTKVVIYARTVCSTFGPFPSFLAAWRHPTRAPNALRIISPTTKDQQPVRVPRQRPPKTETMDLHPLFETAYSLLSLNKATAVLKMNEESRNRLRRVHVFLLSRSDKSGPI